MPVTATAPCALSTATVPEAPWNTAKPGCGDIGALRVPFWFAQLPELAVQVPVPPSMAPLLRLAALPPSQKFSV